MSSRKEFLKQAVWTAAGMVVLPRISHAGGDSSPDLFFDISLAQWSLHRKLRNGELTNLDFPAFAKKEFGIGAVEYVNTFFFDKAEDHTYLKELKTRSGDAGVRNLLIMCDREGQLGNTNGRQRKQAVENHYKWVDAARYLGCHSIRVNAAGSGSREEVARAVTQSLAELSEFAAKRDIHVIVENHGGYSSNGKWLVNVIKNVNHSNCGTLPDFGNFTISDGNHYDRYEGVEEMMPYAKAVSAKSYEFDDDGNETTIDYGRMLSIVKDTGYNGYIGIEYEGSGRSEVEGIRATKKLLERIGAELTR